MATLIVWRGTYGSDWFDSRNWVQSATGLGGPPIPGMDVLINSSYQEITPVVNGVLYGLSITLAPYRLVNFATLSGQTLYLSHTEIDFAGAAVEFQTLTVGPGSSLHPNSSGPFYGGVIGPAGSTLTNQGEMEAANGYLEVHFSSLINQSTIRSSGSGMVFLHGTTLNNTNVISATAGGTISVDFQTTQGNGGLLIDSGGEIDIAGNVASSQKVVFGFFASSAAGTLELDSPTKFSGQIFGFNSSDVLRLYNQNVTSASWSNNQLNLFGSGGVLETLNMRGSYSGSHFAATYDAAHHSSLITVA